MNKKQIIAASLSAILLVSAQPQVLAASVNSTISDADIASGSTASSVTGKDNMQNKETEYQTADVDYAESSSALDVYASQDSTADVLLPKTIILNGSPAAQNIGKYVVGARGNISGEEVIHITPDESTTLSSAGRTTTHVATIEQEKQEFTYEDGVNPDTFTSAVGTISTDSLTSGQWNGEFQFNLGMSVESQESTADYGRAIQSWDISAAQDESVMMTYYQPENDAPQGRSMPRLMAARSAESQTYEDGTVVISGEGEMIGGLSANFIDPNKFLNVILSEYESRYEEECYLMIQNTYEDDEYRWRGEPVNETPSYITAYSNTTNQQMDEIDVMEIMAMRSDEVFKFQPKKLIINEGVTNIGFMAFILCQNITEVNLPDSITTIGEGAFQMTGLSEVKIPKNCTYIGNYAFANNDNLKTVYIPNSIANNNAFCVSSFNDINPNPTFYCQSQNVVDEINRVLRQCADFEKYNFSIIVDSSKF